MRAKRAHLAIASGSCVLCLVAACAVSVNPGGGGVGPSVSFTLGGRTVTFQFGNAGIIDIQANQTTPPRAVGFRLFEEDATDTPSGARMRLSGADVGVGRLLTAKQIARSQAQALNGTATVRFSIAAGTSADLCDTATFLSEYELTLRGGALSVVDDVYELSQQALSIVLQNDVTICIEVTADFGGQISLNSFSLSFEGGEIGTGTAEMSNSDSENIHILLPGEDFDISNRISPGGTRTASLTGLEAGDVINIRAGRNGTVLDTTTCPTVTGANYTATIEWNGFSVTCDAEQSDSGTGPGTGPTPGTTIQVPINALGEAEEPTDTFSGVDYALVGVLDVNSSTTYPPALPSNVTTSLAVVDVDLDELGLQTVEEVYFSSHAAWVPELPDGLTIATLSFEYADGGSSTDVDMTLGSTTAEWSLDRPDHDITIPGGPGHSIIPILYSFETVSVMGYTYDGHVYGQHVTLDSSRTLSSISLTLVDPSTYIDLRDDAPGPPTWSGQASVAMTLVGPATGSSGGGDDGGGGTGETGTVNGQVVDAQTGDPLAEALIAVSGTSLSATSDASGNFTIAGVPSGTVTLAASRTGYVDTTAPILVLPGASVETSIGMLAVGAGGDNVAAVLSWGETPSDLDLHMSGPDGSGGRFHAYYSNKSPVSHVFLDLDDRNAFGPETMTVSPTEGGAFVAGDYHVWVHNYSGSPDFLQSAATVTLFAGGSQIAQYTVEGAGGDASDRIWQIVEFTVSQTGAVSNVNVRQSFTTGDARDVF